MKIIIPLWQTPLSHQAHIKYKLTRWGKPMSYKDSDLAAFQQQFAMLLRCEVNKCGFKRISKEYSITFNFYLKSRKHPDIDNAAKTISDACEGILFENDRYCREMILHIFYVSENPCIEITIEAWG